MEQATQLQPNGQRIYRLEMWRKMQTAPVPYAQWRDDSRAELVRIRDRNAHNLDRYYFRLYGPYGEIRT